MENNNYSFELMPGDCLRLVIVEDKKVVEVKSDSFCSVSIVFHNVDLNYGKS